jgi:tetraprenyl-beta-curcumene synthase
MQRLCFLKEKRSPAAALSAILPPSDSPEMAIPPVILPCILSAQLNGTDMEGFISFALSVLTINIMLENHRHNRDVSQEMEVRKLYSCLSCAVDPSRNSSCPLLHSIKNEPKSGTSNENSPSDQTCLSDRCRLQLAVLPFYGLVAPKMKKYIQFFIDLQSYRYYPPLASVEMLKVWSSGYLQRYHDIYWWEFCAAADSLSGILTMYAAATGAKLSGDEVALLDEACFPWLCGLESLLRSVLQMRTQEAEGLNFASFYSNLKECEERILFFAEKASASFMKLRNGAEYCNILKALISLYLTEPEAEFGMLKLASSFILKKSSAGKYAAAWRLLRISGIMGQAAREA